MTTRRRFTLTQYLIEQRRRFPGASGDFNALLLDVALACKAIARSVAFGELGQRAGPCRARGHHQRQRAGRGTKAPGRHQQRILHPDDRMGRPPGGHGLRGDGPPLPDPRGPAARQIPAGVRPAGRLQQHRRQRDRGQHLQCAARAAGRDRQRARRGRGRLLPARHAAARRGLRALRAHHDAGAVRGQRCGGLHAGPEPGPVHADPPEPADPGRHAGVRHQRLQQPLLGAAGQALSWTSAWPARPARAARTSTCAGSPAWWPRRTGS